MSKDRDFEDTFRVLFLLENGRSTDVWRTRFDKSQVADAWPYGLEPAVFPDWHVNFARDGFRSRLGGLIRRLLRKPFQTDFLHVLFNFKSIMNSDLVVTHTEDTCVAYLLLRRMIRSMPPVVAQVVWAGEDPTEMSAFQRHVVKFSLKNADRVVTLSSYNSKVLTKILDRDVDFVKYGIDPKPFELAIRSESRSYSETFRPAMLAVGNDRHRDWAVVRDLATLRTDWDFTVCTRTAPEYLKSVPNIYVRTTVSFVEIRQLYHQSDCVLIPLKSNNHASGVTVALEAAASDIPFLASRQGGLEEYFGANFLGLIESNSAEDWSDRLDWILKPDVSKELREQARSCMIDGELTNVGYGGRILAVGRTILGGFQ